MSRWRAAACGSFSRRTPIWSSIGESRNGRETLRALDALAPDLLFLDVQMPEMDGFEVLRARGPERMPAVFSSPRTISSRCARSKRTLSITW
jgi:CheY-like chemotaxis protein